VGSPPLSTAQADFRSVISVSLTRRLKEPVVRHSWLGTRYRWVLANPARNPSAFLVLVPHQ
jgi:hypothetical protein